MAIAESPGKPIPPLSTGEDVDTVLLCLDLDIGSLKEVRHTLGCSAFVQFSASS